MLVEIEFELYAQIQLKTEPKKERTRNGEIGKKTVNNRFVYVSD